MLSLFVGALAMAAAAAPAPQPAAAAPPAITDLAQWDALVSGLLAAPSAGFAAEYASLLAAVQPSATPTGETGVAAALASLAAAYSKQPLVAAGALVLSGLTGGGVIGDPVADAEDFGPCNSDANVNTQEPDRTIYPQQAASDAPYSIPEAQLRAAIYFPPTFTHGQTRPVIFVPGTGVTGCEDFAPNIGKIVAGSDYADPVYLNIPHNMLDDEQNNAEYVAYAVNYVSAITGNQNVSVVSWSAGGPITQWALKYWPSTRQYVRSFVPISADFHGTVLVPVICPPGLPCDPGVLQQNYPANWIAQLRKNGGADSLVPTTEIHNVIDEVVEPQVDPLASAYLGDGGPGVANIQIQDYCPLGTLAGGPDFGHENALYNPVAVAIVVDALKYGGVADPARAGPFNCSQLMATGLSLTDVLATEFLIPLAGFNLETYPDKVTVEPPIRAYATY